MTNEVAEEFYNITSEDFSWIAPEFAQEWSAEARAQGWSGEEVDAYEHKFMFVNESGVESVSDFWFTAIQACASCSNHSCHCGPSICAAAYAKSTSSCSFPMQACIARGDLALLLLQVFESSA